MNNNLALFYLYIIITLLFLTPLCYLTSIQLFRIIYSIVFNYLNYDLFFLSSNTTSSTKYIKLFNFYVQQKQWFLCISMLEFMYEKKICSNIILFNNLAYCYNNLSYWQITEYYYLKALLYSSSDLSILKKLFNLYKISNQVNEAEKINKRIFLLDNN